MLIPHCVAAIVSVGMVPLGAGVASGQDYPNKPIRIVTAAAGGTSDFAARLIASGISGPLGQPVTVDNRAIGNIATEVVAKEKPDGYTLLLGGASIWVFPFMQKVSYDPVRDFTPISLLARDVKVVTVHPSLPVKSVKELIALAKAKPGELNYASTGMGGSQHLGAELFKTMAGVNIVHVPFKNQPIAIAALMSGEVQVAVYDAAAVLPHAKTGKLRTLAVTTAEPSALTPGLPTVAASGLPGYEYIGLLIMNAPGKTPAPIINRLNQEMVRVLRLPETKEKLFNAGAEVVASSPEEFAAYIKSDMARMGKVIKDLGLDAR